MGKTQLAKGDYTIKVFLRHDSVLLLEKLRDKVCVVERELGEKVSVPIYSSNSDSVKAANAMKDTTLFPGTQLLSLFAMATCLYWSEGFNSQEHQICPLQASVSALLVDSQSCDDCCNVRPSILLCYLCAI